MDKKFTLTIPEIALPFLRKGIQQETVFIDDPDITYEQCISGMLSMYACLGGLNPDLCQISVDEL